MNDKERNTSPGEVPVEESSVAVSSLVDPSAFDLTTQEGIAEYEAALEKVDLQPDEAQ